MTAVTLILSVQEGMEEAAVTNQPPHAWLPRVALTLCTCSVSHHVLLTQATRTIHGTPYTPSRQHVIHSLLTHHYSNNVLHSQLTQHQGNNVLHSHLTRHQGNT
ncbi:hypothetical protein Pcinc_020708 [Petrolisthes cinctipes]|uniref:Uncharacterized protein n=1 Tax=Petrolisthes cinctipes TaxID=88211 RepID=A0AAE1FHW0_PETCI|nr:hypothetical protein Pcinc_020708 [Petrolisthes cinctipes]